MNIKNKKFFNAVICIMMAALMILTLAGCSTVNEKRTAKLNERLMAMFTQLDNAKDAAVLAETATDEYILEYYNIRQTLVNLSPFLPEGGVAMDKETYRDLSAQIEAAEAEVEAFTAK